MGLYSLLFFYALYSVLCLGHVQISVVSVFCRGVTKHHVLKAVSRLPIEISCRFLRVIRTVEGLVATGWAL
jgi:hypothetical protein